MRTRQLHVQSSQRVISRRELLRAGAVGAGGLALPALARSTAAVAAPPTGAALPGLGRAKSLVVLFLYGAPSQMDTLDPKPEAPQELRGPFKSISTSLPGITASELLPGIASNLHRVALLRSMTHTSNNHAVSVALSGLSKSEPAIEANGNDIRHEPYFGSVLEYLWRQQGISIQSSGIPVNMILPWPLNNRTDPGRWQHHAAWLGKGYNPMFPRFAGQGARQVGFPSIKGSTPILTRLDPWDGVTPASTFRFEGSRLPPGLTTARVADRRKLLGRLNPAAGSFGAAG